MSNNKSSANKSENLHANHRARLRKRFENEGLVNFEPHNALELLLFFSIPRKDTNPIAHKLIDEFGSLSAVFEAPYEALVTVEGVGESTATLIKLVHGLMESCQMDKLTYNDISNYDEMARFMVEYFKNKSEESLIALLLDNNGNLFKIVKICDGVVNSTSIPIKKLSTVLHKYNAAAFLLAHNHPAGSAKPSKDDISLTFYLDSIFSALQIPMREHLVVAGNKYSFILKTISLDIIPKELTT